MLVARSDGRLLRALHPRDVADGLAAPRGWIVGAGIGLLLAVAIVAAGRLRSRALLRVTWREARVEDGCLVFGDGSRTRDPGGRVDGSIVSVRVSTPRAAPTFRTEPAVARDDVAEGPPERRRDESLDPATVAAVLGLATACVSIAPLVIASLSLGRP